MDEEEAYLFATQLSTSSMLPMVLRTAIELDLLELIKKASPSASASELAAQLPAKNPDAANMIDRVLRLLTAHSVLNCSVKTLPDGRVERRYSLAPVCQFLTRNEDGVSVAPYCLMSQDSVLMKSWYHLKDAILEGGIPFNRAYGMAGFEYVKTDPRFSKLFNQAMYEPSLIFMKKILEKYKGFEGLNSLVDVGGGIGASLEKIISKYPSIKGINFDLPHVIENAPSYPGIEHTSGDMFVSVPKADAILLKWVCHDWSDSHCKKLLKNCYEALPQNGKVILVEYIVPEIPDTTLSSKTVFDLDMVMLAHLSGKERTETEFQPLAKEAGFKEFNKVCGIYNFWIIELHK